MQVSPWPMMVSIPNTGLEGVRVGASLPTQLESEQGFCLLCPWVWLWFKERNNCLLDDSDRGNSWREWQKLFFLKRLNLIILREAKFELTSASLKWEITRDFRNWNHQRNRWVSLHLWQISSGLLSSSSTLCFADERQEKSSYFCSKDRVLAKGNGEARSEEADKDILHLLLFKLIVGLSNFQI